jgi:DNA topoisomerase-1
VRTSRQAALATDPAKAAKLARLRYVRGLGPGIRRRRNGHGFVYIAADGRRIRDRNGLARIRRLAIPPAWRDVWICPTASGHLQAVGVDARGRRQYRYHPDWRAVRDETKYHRMVAFARALPRIRRAVKRDLAAPGLPHRKVLATVVRLLETTFLRVGNDEYARDNGSFGLTTLRDRHARISGSNVRFEFRGKGGKRQTAEVSDRRVANVVKRCRDLPGYELFQYLDAEGQRQSVDAADVNDYLRDISGETFTAKDFRTWAGTVLAALALQEFETFDSRTQAKRNVVRAIDRVAKDLGNTPAICRKSYVHPAVIDAYLEGGVVQSLQHRTEHRLTQRLAGLKPEEAAVLALLQQRLRRESERRHAAA